MKEATGAFAWVAPWDRRRRQMHVQVSRSGDEGSATCKDMCRPMPIEEATGPDRGIASRTPRTRPLPGFVSPGGTRGGDRCKSKDHLLGLKEATQAGARAAPGRSRRRRKRFRLSPLRHAGGGTRPRMCRRPMQTEDATGTSPCVAGCEHRKRHEQVHRGFETTAIAALPKAAAPAKRPKAYRLAVNLATTALTSKPPCATL